MGEFENGINKETLHLHPSCVLSRCLCVLLLIRAILSLPAITVTWHYIFQFLRTSLSPTKYAICFARTKALFSTIYVYLCQAIANWKSKESVTAGTLKSTFQCPSCLSTLKAGPVLNAHGSSLEYPLSNEGDLERWPKMAW
jgi:hypothetical protein